MTCTGRPAKLLGAAQCDYELMRGCLLRRKGSTGSILAVGNLDRRGYIVKNLAALDASQIDHSFLEH
jgi:hypothetical protein